LFRMPQLQESQARELNFLKYLNSSNIRQQLNLSFNSLSHLCRIYDEVNLELNSSLFVRRLMPA
jgi:hypothetical protein